MIGYDLAPKPITHSRTLVFIITAILGSWLHVASCNPAIPAVWYSHGFRIDGHLINSDQYARVHDSVDEQLQIVESVGVPVDVINFFRTVPIVIDPSVEGQPAIYGRKGNERAVWIKPISLPAEKPIVLHELLHAYHDQILTLGNSDIFKAYRQARESNMYPRQFRSAHFLDNEKEYFAVIGSIYLYGRIYQPPFTCDIPSSQQPEFMNFLAKQFGHHECNPGK